MGDFERDTRVEGGDGRYQANLSPDWEIWGPNGGYLATIALRAVGAEARVPRPASFAGHFLAMGRFESVEVLVEPVRQGRSSESWRASVKQGGRTLLEAIVRTAAEVPGLEHRYGAAPDVPDPDSLQAFEDLVEPDHPRYPFWRNLDVRPLHPERFGQPWTASDPVHQEWYRYRPRATFEDEPFVDAGRSLLLIDTLSWPAACRPHPDSGFMAPNLDVTAWFHDAAPEQEWLLADHESPVATGGLMGTIGRVWSRDGRLLASGGAQLFCMPARPDAMNKEKAGEA